MTSPPERESVSYTTYLLPSRTNAQKTHRVTVAEWVGIFVDQTLPKIATISCDCPGYKYRQRCWHTRVVERVLLGVPLEEVVNGV